MEAKVTIPALLQMKREGRKSVGVVAWDYQIARIADRAGAALSPNALGLQAPVGLRAAGPADVTHARQRA